MWCPGYSQRVYKQAPSRSTDCPSETIALFRTTAVGTIGRLIRSVSGPPSFTALSCEQVSVQSHLLPTLYPLLVIPLHDTSTKFDTFTPQCYFLGDELSLTSLGETSRAVSFTVPCIALLEEIIWSDSECKLLSSLL